MKARRYTAIISDTLCVLLFVYLLVFPNRASVPTKSALEFCAKTLIPALFIYTVLAKITVSLPITERLERIIGTAPIVLAAGMLCGAPIGAKTALSLYEQGRIDKKYAEYLCSFTNNASASFVLGYVGSTLFGDIFIGVRLFLYQLASSLFTALVMRLYMYGGKIKRDLPNATHKRIKLQAAVREAAESMLGISACVVFFIVAGSAASSLLSLAPLPDAVLRSVLEFSSGCASASKLHSLALPVCAFSIGFSGLSVALQVSSAGEGRIGIRPYLLGKLISGSCMTLLAVIFG